MWTPELKVKVNLFSILSVLIVLVVFLPNLVTTLADTNTVLPNNKAAFAPCIDCILLTERPSTKVLVCETIAI